MKKVLNMVGFDRQKLYRNKFVDKIAWLIPRAVKNVVRKNISSSTRTIDWNNTLAYAELGSKYSWGININLKERETDGIVGQEKFEELKKEITAKLKNIRNENGELVFDKVFCGDDIYSGDFKKRGTDILFTMRDKNQLVVSRFDNKIWGDTTSHTHSYHDSDGIFMAYGNGVKAGIEVRDMNILDVVPTVLKYYGMEKNDGMDGKAVGEIYETQMNANFY